MTTMHSGPMPSRPVNPASHIALVEPLRWLSLGWRDFRRAPAEGLGYGLILALTGSLLFMVGDHPYFLVAAIFGFVLLGVILGAGLIDSSRAIEHGDKPNFDSSVSGLEQNRPALERFALALLAIAAVWLALSTSVLTAAMGSLAPSIEQTLWDSALLSMSSQQLFAWTAIGAVLAVLWFSISIIAVPLILDQHSSVGDAIRGSLRAVSRHPLASIEWALLIALLTAIGFATALAGIIVIYPVLAHASWHAYRALQR